MTDPQRQAASHVDGPALILAGPGSGKTRVITRRVAWLLVNGIPAWQVLALTFTNKAAGEMRDRIDALLPDSMSNRRGLFVSTFHAFCARQLRQHGERIGLDPGFSIYDTSDQRAAMKEALNIAGLESGNWTPASTLSAVSHAKNQLKDAAAYEEEASDFYTRSIARAFRAYEGILQRNNAVDFDDLLLRTAGLLRTNEEVRVQLQDRFRYVLIDEYQDTNHAQFVIADAIASAHGNLFVVGDPDQSIYGWRGADVGNILEFEEKYPGTLIIPLGRNFRSTGHIVSAASGLIQNNRRRKHKDLHTELGDGDPVHLRYCQDERHEAEQVADAIRTAAAAGLEFREMAVLYRVNALSRVLEDALRSASLPYVIARGTAFFERREIKDALAYLRALSNPVDDVALSRIVNVPARQIGSRTLKAIERHALHERLSLLEALEDVARVDGLGARAIRAVTAFVQMFKRWRTTLESGHLAQLPGYVAQVITESGLEGMHLGSGDEEGLERVANLNELVSAAAEFEMPEEIESAEVAGGEVEVELTAMPTLVQALRSFLESVALVSDQDAIDQSQGAVTLMTLHAAKGLEFDFVAMVGLEEGLLPHARSQEGEHELEEERRLCYVGMTRAKRSLHLSLAASRSIRGQRSRTIQSSFIGELPEAHLEVDRLDGSGEFEDGYSIEYDAEFADEPHDGGGVGFASRFPAGTVVRHPQFGIGTVKSISPRGTVSSARVAFHGIGTKTLILEYARLELVHG
ncbi:MAG: UvrD-helicase domain-containing protein [Planctomycetota bacterium]|nr:UvrD-helicase domain-containing protein [Planctomycetota bacterium]